ARGAHLARAADGEAVAGDEERLAAVDAGAEVGHQVAERARLPALVQRLEALRHAVGGGRDLVGVDRVQLLPRRTRIPEHERAAGAGGGGGRGRGAGGRRRRGLGPGQALERDAGLQTGGLEGVHTRQDYAARSNPATARTRREATAAITPAS